MASYTQRAGPARCRHARLGQFPHNLAHPCDREDTILHLLTLVLVPRYSQLANQQRVHRDGAPTYVARRARNAKEDHRTARVNYQRCNPCTGVDHMLSATEQVHEVASADR